MIQAISEALGGVSEGVVYALLVLGAVQFVIQIWALVDLVKIDRVVGGRKWLWALAILLLSNFSIGAILYFFIGRRVPKEISEADAPVASDSDRTKRAVDSLYGDESSDR